MTTRVAAALLASLLASLVQAQTPDASHSGHAHDAHTPPAVAPAPAGSTTRFATDDALRTGMAGIRGAVAVLAHHEAGHLGAQQVREQAGAIEKQVDYLIANCKLEPQADATLHGIISHLLGATRALHDDPADPTPVAALRAALTEYSERFDESSTTD